MSIKFTNLKISRARTIRPVGYEYPRGLSTGIPTDVDAEEQPFSTGGTVTYTDTKVVHTFTTSGELRTFFTTIGNSYADTSTPLTADVLLIGGGGSGGGSPVPQPGHYQGGGGGAGGVVYTSGLSISKDTPFTVVVGGGGVQPQASSPAGCGGPSAFGNNVVGFPTHPEAQATTPIGNPNHPQGANFRESDSPGEAGSIIAIGGGAGGTYGMTGAPGGSGGGSGRSRPDISSGVPTQGNPGKGGGEGGPGGGAAPPGTTIPGIPAGQQNPQCNGVEYSISGSPVYYAGGGGHSPAGPTAVTGGYGGGGTGVNYWSHRTASPPILDNYPQRAGVANRGGGGGGCYGNLHAQGGSGIVIIAIDRTTQLSGFDIN